MNQNKPDSICKLTCSSNSNNRPFSNQFIILSCWFWSVLKIGMTRLFFQQNNQKIILEWTLINAEPGLFSYFHCNEFENHDFKSEIVSKTLNLNLALYICNSVNLTPLKIIAWRSTVTKYILKTFYHSRVWKFDPQQPLVWWSDI